MLRNQDFIIFSDDWGRHPFSCQHIMRRFLPENRLLWVHTIGLRTPRLNVYDVKRSVEKIRSWFAPAAEPHVLPDNLHIVSPVMIPFNRLPGIRAFNKSSVVRTVQRAMHAFGLRSPIVLATLPNACDYVGAFGESLVVYYCVDDFALWPGMDQPELVRTMEHALLAKADMVAATSEALCASRRGNGPTYLLAHGVDTDHFSQPATMPRPEALRDLSGPIIGFYGLIDERLDLALLEACARQHPDWNIVLIGSCRISLEAFAALPNVRVLPPVAYEKLPAYAACFDVAVVPYRLDALTDSINPLKLREYLAAGKPVAGTPLPELCRLSPPVHVGADVEGFIHAVEAALADTSSPESRRSVLKGETWGDKAELLSGWMVEALDRRARKEAL